MHRRVGRCHLTDDGCDEAARNAIIDSWLDRLLLAPYDWRDVRLQVCVDRIERDEIVTVAPLDGRGACQAPDAPPGVAPQLLPARAATAGRGGSRSVASDAAAPPGGGPTLPLPLSPSER
jgi:hypothetical protein